MESERGMVERVGEALARACREEFGSEWSNDVRWKFARAAIKALREPTPEITAAWQRLNQPYVGYESAPPEHVWAASIDAALDPAP